MSDKSSHSHSDGKFDFNVSSGAILNLFSRDYQYLRFPGAEHVNAQFDQLRQEMAVHSQAFKPPPKNSPLLKSFLEAKREPVVFGDVLVSEDGGFKWRLYSFSLYGDLLRIKRPRKNKEYRKEVLYSFNYRAPLLERLREGFPIVTMVKLYLKNGKEFDLRCPREEDTLMFHKTLKQLWREKYTREEIEERKKAVHALRDCSVKALKLGVKKFNLFARAFWNYSPPPLQRSGHANLLLSDGRARPIFVELSSFSIVLLLPRTPQGQEHRHVDTFLVLNIVQVVDDPDPTIFYLKTPFKSLKLKVPHHVAKLDWLSALNAILTGNEAPDPGQSHAAAPVSNPQYPTKGYKYSASIKGRISLVHEDSGKIWKLTGDGPWTIGRSRDNSICLTSDPYLSRHHGKIEVKNNVPFIIDQGTRAGLTLNGESVNVHPLRPNDRIVMAQSKFTFQVAGGHKLFRLDGSDGTSRSSSGAYQNEESSGASFNWSSQSSRSSWSELRSGRSEETLPPDAMMRRPKPSKGATKVFNATASLSTSQMSISSSSSNRSSRNEDATVPIPATTAPPARTPSVRKVRSRLPDISEQRESSSPLRGHQSSATLDDAFESSSESIEWINRDKGKEKEKDKEREKEFKSSKGKGSNREKD